MITVEQLEVRKQHADEGMVIYLQTFQVIDGVKIEHRDFHDEITLGANQPEKPQCTIAEMEEWKAAHPDPTPADPTYEEKVVSLIRQKYDVNQELHAIRCRDTEPDRFAEYDAYVRECLEKAKEEDV